MGHHSQDKWLQQSLGFVRSSSDQQWWELDPRVEMQIFAPFPERCYELPVSKWTATCNGEYFFTKISNYHNIFTRLHVALECLLTLFSGNFIVSNGTHQKKWTKAYIRGWHRRRRCVIVSMNGWMWGNIVKHFDWPLVRKARYKDIPFSIFLVQWL